MATVKEFRMSQERYDELKHELEYSKTTRADEIAELIKEARGFGDLSENSEYDEAKNEQGKLYSRIAELEEILLHAVIVDESDVDSDRISIGCRVTVTNLDNGKQLPEYTIVGSQEANVMERKVSEDSPFGKALMGTKAGDQITVEAPRGVIHYRVDTIEREPERRTAHGRTESSAAGPAGNPSDSPGQAQGIAGRGNEPLRDHPL